jgi:hypothetical protein
MRRRFIEEQNLGTPIQGARQDDALALSA